MPKTDFTLTAMELKMHSSWYMGILVQKLESPWNKTELFVHQVNLFLSDHYIHKDSGFFGDTEVYTGDWLSLLHIQQWISCNGVGPVSSKP